MGHMLCDDLAVQREGLTKAAKYWPQGSSGKKAALCPWLVSVEVRGSLFFGTMKLITLVR